MRNSTTSYSKMLVAISILLVLVACKKNSSLDKPGDTGKEITTKDLLDYYIVAEHKTGGNKLLVLYFSQEGNVIKSNAHLQGYLRTKEVTIKNSEFNIDYNGDGNSMYSFALEKDATGRLKLKSYDFRYNGVSNQLTYAIMVKRTEALAFTNSSFIADNSTFTFSTDGNSETISWPVASNPYYKLANIGLKTANDMFLAVTVPSWNGINTPIMLLEKDDILFIASKKDTEAPGQACNLVFPGIAFRSKSTDLAIDHKAILSSVAQTLRSNPGCKVVVTGYCTGDFQDRLIGWNRVRNIIQYFSETQDLNNARFIFRYAQPGGDCNDVYLTNAQPGQPGGGVVPLMPSQ